MEEQLVNEDGQFLCVFAWAARAGSAVRSYARWVRRFETQPFSPVSVHRRKRAYEKVLYYYYTRPDNPRDAPDAPYPTVEFMSKVRTRQQMLESIVLVIDNFQGLYH
jgi:hypothetical protein